MDSAKEWFQTTFNNIWNPNHTPSYRGSELRRQSTIDKSLRPSLNPQNSMVLSKGLINKPGQNNCFLNSAVQILWHNDIFRRSFRQFEGHTCDGDPCIFCALKVLFTQFQHGGQFAAIPPDALRVAMSNCYENLNRFQLGLMDDAAECFEKILEQIHFNLTGTNNLDSCSTSWCVSHQKFALSTVEQTVCKCRAQSEPLPFVEFVHYITTSQLVKHSLKLKSEQRVNTFDTAMNLAGSCVEDLTCQDYPRCQRTPYMRRILLNSPDVICIGFIWDSESPPISFIMNVVEAIDTKIRPSNLFSKVVADSMKDVTFKLSAMITYYGRHYSTYCYHTHKQEWIYFDDAKFRRVGKQWSTVVEECRKSRFQPLLLVFSNPSGGHVDASNAPTKVTMSSSESVSKAAVSETPPQPPPHKKPSAVVPVTSSPSVQALSYVNTLSADNEKVEYSEVRTGNHRIVDSNARGPHYVNQSIPGYITTAANNQPTYDDVVSNQSTYDDIVNNPRQIQHPPKIQKQEKPIIGNDDDLIQFSITPTAAAAVTTANSVPITQPPQPPATTTGGKSMVTGNPFVVQDSMYKQNPKMPSSIGTQQPQKPAVPYKPSQITSTGSSLNTSVNKMESQINIYKLESQVRGLPKNIRDAICHGGACLKRASQTTNDPVMIAILLDSALTRIHSVINHPSVKACSELHHHLTKRKEALQTKLSQVMPELEKARSDPLSIRAVLLPTDESVKAAPVKNDNKYPNTTTRATILKQCTECKIKRLCDDNGICGPCSLKLKIYTNN